MLGIVFREFMSLVEAKFGADVLDDVFDGSVLESGGAYTAVGNYDHVELLTLVGGLSRRTGVPTATLVSAFADHLFSFFASNYPVFFETSDNPLELLAQVENWIHVEVRKLYPTAELPTFEFDAVESGVAEMLYKSARPFAALAEGLILACGRHFEQELTVSGEVLCAEPGDHQVRFRISTAAGRLAA